MPASDIIDTLEREQSGEICVDLGFEFSSPESILAVSWENFSVFEPLAMLFEY